MIEWWNSLHRDQHYLLIYALGIAITGILIIISSFHSLYEEYVEYIKGEKDYEPRFEIGGESIAVMILWPLMIVMFIFIGIGNAYEYISPTKLIKKLAIRRHRALIVTSPNEKIRGLVKNSKQQGE